MVVIFLPVPVRPQRLIEPRLCAHRRACPAAGLAELQLRSNLHIFFKA